MKDSMKTWLLIALVLSFGGSKAQAQEPQQLDYDPVQKREAKGALYWFNHGVELAREGDYKDALKYFEKARELSPAWALPHLEIATAHMMTDNDRKKIQESLEKAVRFGRSVPRAHYMYGLFMQELGKREEAVKALNQALELRPSMVEARFRLAALYIEEGRQQDGIYQYQLLLERRPSHLGAHRNLAMLYEQSGQLENAERHLKAIVKLYPHIALHLIQLGKFYQRVGWQNKAAAVFSRAKRLDPPRKKRKLRPLLKSRHR